MRSASLQSLAWSSWLNVVAASSTSFESVEKTDTTKLNHRNRDCQTPFASKISTFLSNAIWFEVSVRVRVRVRVSFRVRIRVRVRVRVRFRV